MNQTSLRDILFSQIWNLQPGNSVRISIRLLLQVYGTEDETLETAINAIQCFDGVKCGAINPDGSIMVHRVKKP